jgi:hypothetical protein
MSDHAKQQQEQQQQQQCLLVLTKFTQQLSFSAVVPFNIYGVCLTD